MAPMTRIIAVGVLTAGTAASTSADTVVKARMVAKMPQIRMTGTATNCAKRCTPSKPK